MMMTMNRFIPAKFFPNLVCFKDYIREMLRKDSKKRLFLLRVV